MISLHSSVASARSVRSVSCAVMILAGALALSATTTTANAQPQGKTNQIKIEYQPAKTPAQQKIADLIKERKVLEKFQEILSPFKLPQPLTLLTKSCGMVNAWYQRPTLTICYEYLEDIQKSIPKGTTSAGLTPADTVIGQLFYVVAHEAGHAFFDQLNVPLFGRAEDAADGFATYLMLALGKNEARRLIGGAAYSYKPYLGKEKFMVPATAFSDAHGAPLQRFYNLLCLAFGSDPSTYKDLVDQGYLPKDRARSCRMEYGELNFAFQRLILPNVDKDMAKAVLARDWMADATMPAERASDQGQPQGMK
jgi:hypothetical protein